MNTKSLFSLSGHIRLNEPLPWDVVDSLGRPLLRKGVVISDQRQLAALLERGIFVDRGEYERYFEDSPPPPPPQPTNADPFWDWDSVHQRLGNALHEDVVDPAFVQNIENIVADIERLTEKERDASIFAMIRLDMTRYPVAHSLRTAFVAGLIARGMGMGDAERLTLLKAALTMNIAMIELQNVLHKQATPLSDAQRAEIKTHPARGVRCLETFGVTDPGWLRTVAQHHETSDGKGYPAGLTDISPLAEVIHYAEAYCATMSNSAHRKAVPAKSAARALFVAAADVSGINIPALIIKELGIYPPGSFVKLANGEIGVVVRRGSSASAPRVAGLQNRQGVTYIKPTNRNTTAAEFAVIEAVMPEDDRFQLSPMRLFGYET